MEFNIAHYALQKLNILPSQLVSMERKERAFVYASCLLRAEEEKRAAKSAAKGV